MTESQVSESTTSGMNLYESMEPISAMFSRHARGNSEADSGSSAKAAVPVSGLVAVRSSGAGTGALFSRFIADLVA